MEPNMGLELMTLRSRPELRSRPRVRCLTDWATQAPRLPSLFWWELLTWAHITKSHRKQYKNFFHLNYRMVELLSWGEPYVYLCSLFSTWCLKPFFNTQAKIVNTLSNENLIPYKAIFSFHFISLFGVSCKGDPVTSTFWSLLWVWVGKLGRLPDLNSKRTSGHVVAHILAKLWGEQSEVELR